MARVDIALATYDGAPFLAEQLESILAQSHAEWRLIVRDDGSTDETRAILERYRRDAPDRIVVLDDDDGTLGHARNFARLLAHCDGPYVALCDQDDVWLPDKLRTSLAEVRRLERQAGAATPALVFTDAAVVDADLRTVAASFWAHTGVHPEDSTVLGRMLHGNVVAAHTTLFNATLRDLALPLPPSALYVDWWIAALAAAIGATAFVTEPTVLHRQHGGNVAGARPPLSLSPRSGLEYFGRRKGTARERELRYGQAAALRERVGDRLDADSAAAVEAFLALPELNAIERVRRARRHGLLPRDLVRSAIFVCTAPSWTAPDAGADPPDG